MSNVQPMTEAEVSLFNKLSTVVKDFQIKHVTGDVSGTDIASLRGAYNSAVFAIEESFDLMHSQEIGEQLDKLSAWIELYSQPEALTA